MFVLRALKHRSILVLALLAGAGYELSGILMNTGVPRPGASSVTLGDQKHNLAELLSDSFLAHCIANFMFAVLYVNETL